MPRTEVSPLTEAELARAVEVWRESRTASAKRPSAARVERVEAKLRAALAAPAETAVVVRYGEHVVGVAAAEPYADEQASDTGQGHVSMVFVLPAYWGLGLGSALLRHLQQGAYESLSLWTRTGNRRGLRLYEACGFTDTGDRSTLHDETQIARWVWRGSVVPTGSTD